MMTPLHTAAMNGNLSEVRKALQERKTDVNARSALTPLHMCVSRILQDNRDR